MRLSVPLCCAGWSRLDPVVLSQRQAQAAAGAATCASGPCSASSAPSASAPHAPFASSASSAPSAPNAPSARCYTCHHPSLRMGARSWSGTTARAVPPARPHWLAIASPATCTAHRPHRPHRLCRLHPPHLHRPHHHQAFEDLTFEPLDCRPQAPHQVERGCTGDQGLRALRAYCLRRGQLLATHYSLLTTHYALRTTHY